MVKRKSANAKKARVAKAAVENGKATMVVTLYDGTRQQIQGKDFLIRIFDGFQNQNDTKTIDGVECIKVEPDIDYYKDIGAHTLLEVIPNAATHGLTDPKKV